MGLWLWLGSSRLAAGAEGIREGLEMRKPGETFRLGNCTVKVKRMDVVPLVENVYSAVHLFDSFENPKLRRLREQEGLDDIVAPGEDEFDRQVLLMDWVFKRFKKFGRPTSKASGALEILKAVDEGNTFFCAHYGKVLVSAAASLGWVDRMLAMKRPAGMGEGATEHTITEIWSNQHRKWVMLDPTFAMYVEKDGVPLNAYEIRQEWFYADGEGLVFVIGADRKRHTKKDLPIFRGHFPGYGNLRVTASTIHKYAFIGYVPNTNLMDSGPDWGKMFITKDAICDGTKWHIRKNPENPAKDPYFPMNQAALTLSPAGGMKIDVRIRTLTPNFKTFMVRFDGKEWRDCGPALTWVLHGGANSLEAKSVNRFGVEGPVSVAELEAAR